MMQNRSHGAGPVFSKALRREVIILVLVKLAALFLIYQIFFAPYKAPPLSREKLMHHLLGP